MADVQEYAARLAQEIGPRPAGTEEEQQASFVIEEILQEEAALDVRSEEFNCNPNYDLPRTICCIITVVLAALTLILPLMVIPSLVVCLITAVLFALEVLGISPLGRTSKRGVSQNVIGKYVPVQNGEAPVARRRKVVVVARYDTGRVRRELTGPVVGALNVIHWIELGSMILVPIVLLVRALTAAEGPLLIVLIVLTAVGIVGALLPIIVYIMRQTAPYNEGANCNAAGVAVMLEVAKRVGLGLYDQGIEEDVAVHGKEAAREAGVLPANAEVEYAEEVAAGDTAALAAVEASPAATSAMAPMDLSAEIAAAQAARSSDAVVSAPENAAAAETISVAQSAPMAEQAVVAEETVVTSAAAAPAPAAAAPAPAAAVPAAAAEPIAIPGAQKQDNVPDWYKRAQAKANRASSDATPVQRSRFADAIDGATAAREAEAARLNEERTSAMDARLAEMRESIMNSPNAAEAHATAKAAASEQAALEAEAATDATAGEQAAHQTGGVDGFLASTTEAPDYETASAAGVDAPATTETKKAGEVADRLLSRDLPPKGEAKGAEAEGKPEAKPEAKPASKTAGLKAKAKQAKKADHAEPRRKRAITLPSLTGAIEAVNSQSIPLEDEEEAVESALPTITEITEPERRAVGSRASRESFASNIPALGAKARHAASASDEEQEVVSVAGSFSVGGATGAFNPVGDELLADVDPDDIYVDDADDSDYDDGFTVTGAMTSPSQVQMPSRRGGVLGRFRRKKDEEETSFAEAIGVDADFDARKVGRDRGGWESFRNDSSDFDSAWDEDDEWNGGAFSRDRLGSVVSKIKPGRNEDPEKEPRRGKGKRDRHADGDADQPRTRFAGTDLDEDAEYDDAHGSHRNLHPFADIPLKGLGEDREAIHEFHDGPINMEVWFVALGAELADNAGMKALMAEHGVELRGSMVIDLDGLGAGDLSLIEREGMYRPVKMSSRMKRYVRKAADSLGLKVGTAQMLWCNTAAYLATRQGYQTLHVAGMEGGKPAYLAQADDAMDNVDPDLLAQNANFLMEIIRAI